VGIVDVVKIVLEEANYNVVVSSDSETVLPTVRSLKPDLILIDLWMPGLGGEQIIPLLKKDTELAWIPVIIISASKDTREVAERVGADGMLHKPFDIAELERIVKKHLS
jgi:DNA-binding response OmpR family regulator